MKCNLTINDGAPVATRIQTITAVARCESEAALRKAIEFAACVIHPTTEIAKVVVTRPGGVERREARVFILGDYFSGIELIPCESGGPASFLLIFHIREGVTSFWKDMLMAVLDEISQNVPGAKMSIVPGSAKA